ncbi:PucR family transcriptional regulator [Glaciibacter psychrotolerans]|uniref:Purine catabolism regulator n=1 Tax=Glaciibacter psychrotolerans TaxID=670054 RepID=A0A7Z0EFH4_9MICO|nr:PucR family transcriptional regulator ligand-binding domain-containing protein [Leifsonia psychrotolerans]NYJ20664.1 purine catabolism regulator [Leifsonia psychrotolerans]
MPDRPVFGGDQTERPEAVVAPWAALPTVGDVLRMPVLAAALPELLAGHDSLGTPVRWVHVSDSLGVATLLDGGELLLATGVGFLADAAALTVYIEELVGAGVAGLVLELVPGLEQVPPAILEACLRLNFPLVVLHKVVKFVAVTEAVHSRIISGQTEALRARAELHDLFVGLSLRGSPADYIVAQLARVLNAPVVLENLNHQVVAVESLTVGDTILADWEQRSRAARRDSVGGAAEPDEPASGWDIVPVEARGIRWGYLVALPGPLHPAGRSSVMQQAAVALALGRLADRDADEWTRQGHEQLLAGLLGGRYVTELGVSVRLEAAGLRVRDRLLLGVVVAVPPTAAAVAAALTAAAALGADAIAAAHPGGRPAQLMVALSLPADARFTDAAATAFARDVQQALGPAAPDIAVGIGGEAHDAASLLASLEEASELLRRSASAPRRGVSLHRVENRPLLRLVTALGSDPRLQAHSEQMLRPLIEHDLENGGGLLPVLAAFAAHPGNRTKAASASHLSRSVFYQRIALIEDLLDVDLDDGETVSALHTALLARGTLR